jgi:uncharacterized protein with LGFP repeats
MSKGRFSHVLSYVAAGTVATLALLFAFASTPAYAANAKDFQPGNIISDAIFFNGSDMTSNQVQAFLDAHVTTCRTGYTCLKDYRQATPTVPANRCAPYAGAVSDRASDIIAKVGASCGINPKVLLVLLEKEQSLVTDTWPLTSQYTHATGFSCPDTAPCDPAFAGFFYQVYYAARQFITYRMFPDAFNYHAGQVNNILLNPNPSCGTAPVFITNQATANLYIYTPYQPNAAALANLYGVGDGCSTYGNRNFWRLFTDWFGSTQGGPTPPDYKSAISAAYAAAGGAGGFLGAETSDYISNDSNGGGWIKLYTGGAIAYTDAGGAHPTRPPLRQDFLALDGVNGPLGWPTGDQVAVTGNGGGLAQQFQNGKLFRANSATNAFYVQGAALSTYAGAGGASGSLGWPTSQQTCPTGACVQTFQNGKIYTLASGTSFALAAPFSNSYTVPADVSTLGAPTGTATTVGANGGGSVQAFNGGALTVRSQVGSPVIHLTGRVRTYYNTTGGVSGPLGWPVTEATCTATSCSQRFQNASITCPTVVTVSCSDTRTPAPTLTPTPTPSPKQELPTARTLIDAAASQSNPPVGTPITEYLTLTASGGGTVRAYANNAAVAYSPSRGAFTISGQIRTYFNQQGGLAGRFGWPTSNATCATTKSCSQGFQGGVLTWSPVWGSHLIADSLKDGYLASGGAAGPLGAVTSEPITTSVAKGGTIQVFETGVMTRANSSASSYFMTQKMRTYFNQQGGLAGRLGWPTNNATCASNGTCTQTFQQGTITLTGSGVGSVH